MLVADRGGGGRARGRGAQLAAVVVALVGVVAVVADLVVAVLVAVAGVRAVVADLKLGRGGGGAGARPWRGGRVVRTWWSPIAAVALVVVVAELVVVAVPAWT